jgi:hypothetical protein
MPAPAVDVRRFRTWDVEPGQGAQPPWRIVARYGYVRLASGWMGRILLVLLAVFAVVVLGGSSYGMASGAGLDHASWAALLTVFGYALALILILVGGPLFAEDLRFNAPLFYFSKPLRPVQYLAGKVAFLGSLVAAAVVLPVVLMAVLALAIGVPSSKVPELPPYVSFSAAERAEWIRQWQLRNIDTVGDWATAVSTTLPAFLALTAMLVAVMVACSLHTRRGWHASIAFVALVGGLGLAGVVLSDSGDTALAHVGGPFGWAYLMVYMPLELAFTDTSNPYSQLRLENAGTAIAVSYALTLLATAIAVAASLRRIRTQEARS